MKTEQEIREADKRELEIKAEKVAADKAAHLEFHEDTKEEWDKYIAVWHPAKAEWEAFSRPFFEALQAKLLANGKGESEALAEVRSNWGVCPRCGTPASRFQTHCSGDKCPANLVTEGMQNG